MSTNDTASNVLSKPMILWGKLLLADNRNVRDHAPQSMFQKVVSHKDDRVLFRADYLKWSRLTGLVLTGSRGPFTGRYSSWETI